VSLFAFNLGIEIGQLLVLALICCLVHGAAAAQPCCADASG
jgi:hypothetical protein